MRSTPAMKDRTAKYTATSREAEDRLSVIKRRGEPKAPVKIKEQKPELLYASGVTWIRYHLIIIALDRYAEAHLRHANVSQWK